MKQFIKRQKWMIITIVIIILVIVGLGIWITYLNNSSQTTDILMWIEVIVIGLLVNIVSAFFIIAFVDDKEKKAEAKKKQFLLATIAVNNKGIKEMVCNIHERFTMTKFEDADERNKYLLGLITQSDSLLKFDYSTICPLMTIVDPFAPVTNGNWIEYIYKTISEKVFSISDFFPTYVPYLSIELTNEVYDYLKKMKNQILTWEKNDLAIVTNTNYFPKKDNAKLLIIISLPSILKLIFDIDKLLIKEAPLG